MSTGSNSGRFLLAGVLLCFFVSGFSALLYQTAWLRQFSLVFGTSELAVAAVLAAYMGGLALGAALAARFLDRVTRPILTYGLLEAGIAVSAFAVPLLLAAAGGLYAVLLGGQELLPAARTFGQPVFYLVAGFLVLAVPTALMGATLPLLTRYAVRSDREIGPRVAALYAINTTGAVAGAVVAAFLLLPALGLIRTVWVGVAGNALVFAVAALLARANEGDSDPDSVRTGIAETGVSVRHAAPAPGFRAACVEPLLAGHAALIARLRNALTNQPVWILPLMLISGANAFFYEVLWTRLLSHVLGGSIYAFATMLAAFLAGIAIGGGFGGRVAREREGAALKFAIVQAAIALLSVAVYFWMQMLVPEARGTQQFVVYAMLVMLPATVFIGATFPLAVRILAPGEHDAGRSTARVYSWNTVGAILGAVLAAFWLIPALGFAGSAKLAVIVNCALALGAAALLAPIEKRAAAAFAVLLAVAALAWYPQRPESVISNTAFELPDGASGSQLYFGVGRSSTVLLNEADGYFDLRTNGLPEASILPKGAAPVGQVQQWLTALPLIARPDAESLLLVGLGGGVALEDAPASLRTIDVIELEPEVVAANSALEGLRLTDPLEDERINIVLNDARNALRLTDQRFDIIVSQPSHPWTAGASHLFSREYFSLAQEHLSDGGVFLQWMSAGFVDEPLLRSLTATLVDVFANVRLYQPATSVLLFLASDAQLEPERLLASTGRPLSADPLYYSYMRLNGVSDLVASLLLDAAGARAFAADAPITTDDMNRMATESRSLSDGLSAVELYALLADYDPLADAESFVHAELPDAVDLAYIASRLVADGQSVRAERLAATTADPSTAALIDGLVRANAGDPAEAEVAYRRAADLDPSNDAARFVLVQPSLTRLALGIADEETRIAASGLGSSARAVVQGWRHAVEENWPRLAALDAELSRAVPTDIWFPEAAQLRADWRTRVGGDQIGDAASAAIRIIDRALVIRPSLELLFLRAAAADAIGDSDAFIESVRYATALVRERVDAVEAGSERVGRAELETMFRRIVALRGRLVQQPDERDRTRPLSDHIGEQLARIQVLTR